MSEKDAPLEKLAYLQVRPFSKFSWKDLSIEHTNFMISGKIGLKTKIRWCLTNSGNFLCDGHRNLHFDQLKGEKIEFEVL